MESFVPQDRVYEAINTREIDPLSLLDNLGLSATYYFAREYEQSRQQANRALEIDPKYPQAIEQVEGVDEVTGEYKRAIEQRIKLAQALGDRRGAEEVRQVFEKSGYQGYLRKDAKDKEAGGDYYGSAEDYALLGAKDAAFVALERAAAEGQALDNFKLDPALDSLRSDPRYADLLRRVGLPQ